MCLIKHTLEKNNLRHLVTVTRRPGDSKVGERVFMKAEFIDLHLDVHEPTRDREFAFAKGTHENLRDKLRAHGWDISEDIISKCKRPLS